MRGLLLCTPYYVMPLALVTVPLWLIFARKQVLPLWTLPFLLSPFAVWFGLQFTVGRSGTLSNSVFEPLACGIVTGLILVPQLIAPGDSRTEAVRRFWAGVVAATIFAIFVGTSFPALPE